jgi:hypothetical protein
MKIKLMIVAFITLILIGCSSTTEKNIIGKWSYEIPFPKNEEDEKFQLKIKCFSEYYLNKSLKHDCEMNVFGLVGNEKEMIIEGKIRMTGDWKIFNQTIYDKTLDSKFEINKISIDGIEIKIKDTKLMDTLKKNFENPMLKGETNVYKTIYLDEKKWVYELEIQKKKMLVTATKY